MSRRGGVTLRGDETVRDLVLESGLPEATAIEIVAFREMLRILGAVRKGDERPKRSPETDLAIRRYSAGLDGGAELLDALGIDRSVDAP